MEEKGGRRREVEQENYYHGIRRRRGRRKREICNLRLGTRGREGGNEARVESRAETGTHLQRRVIDRVKQ